MASELNALRPEFDKAGTRLTVISAIDTGAQDFIDAVWPEGDLYIDPSEEFKKALGGDTYRTWWLLRPSVMRSILSYARSFGSSTADVTDKKTQLLGGIFVVKNRQVVYAHQETATFDNGDAKAVLAAVLGKDVGELRGANDTPKQSEVCSADQDVCAR